MWVSRRFSMGTQGFCGGGLAVQDLALLLVRPRLHPLSPDLLLRRPVPGRRGVLRVPRRREAPQPPDVPRLQVLVDVGEPGGEVVLLARIPVEVVEGELGLLGLVGGRAEV